MKVGIHLFDYLRHYFYVLKSSDEIEVVNAVPDYHIVLLLNERKSKLLVLWQLSRCRKEYYNNILKPDYKNRVQAFKRRPKLRLRKNCPHFAMLS